MRACRGSCPSPFRSIVRSAALRTDRAGSGLPLLAPIDRRPRATVVRFLAALRVSLCLLVLAMWGPVRAEDHGAPQSSSNGDAQGQVQGDPASGLRAGPAPDPSTLSQLFDDGVRLIVDLRTPSEGVAEEAVAAAESGIRYVNLPVGREAADAGIVARLALLVGETDGGVLLHCRSGNRAGEVLARYLLAAGVPLQGALDAGRAAGLQQEREAFVVGPAAP